MDGPVVIEPVLFSENIDVDPLINNFNTESGNKGFPFDDSHFENRNRGSFKSHLDDLTRRHPELAEHLNFNNKFEEFPFRSKTLGRNRRSSLLADDNPEPTSFRQSSRFNSPLNSEFEREFNFPFTKEHNEFVPSKNQEPSQTEEASAKPPQVPVTNDRSRKPNPNVPQSNTVDLGQKQEPVRDTREQRSMSAPPENRAGQQRFVSSINIPVQGENESNTAQSQSHQSKHQQSSNERVIPIHVEGRDVPVMPKNANHVFNQSQPQPDKAYNQRPPAAGFGSTWNRGDTPYYTGEPQFRYQEPHNFYNNTHNNEAFGSTGPFKQQKPHTEPPPQPQNPPQQSQQPQQVPPQPQQQRFSPPPPPTIKLGPIEQIQQIQKDVLELMNQVEKFNGKPKDRECVYLDEMLTRNLLKLDDVETDGKENIRNARREAIKCIQKCISILEAKANANELLHNHLMDISKAPLTSLEVSGVSRCGTEASLGQEDSFTSEEQPMNEEQHADSESGNKDTTPIPEPVLPTENVQQPSEPTKPESNVTDVEMSSEVIQATDPEGTKEQPMEVEEPKEKKEKKKVKKKVDKVEKH